MTVSCDSGYSIFGNGVIECQTGGVWNASAGTCGKGIHFYKKGAIIKKGYKKRSDCVYWVVSVWLSCE